MRRQVALNGMLSVREETTVSRSHFAFAAFGYQM